MVYQLYVKNNKEHHFSCSYKELYDIKMQLIKCFIKHLEELFITNTKSCKIFNEDLNNIINLYYSMIGSNNSITGSNNYLSGPNNFNINAFISQIKLEEIDALIYFNLSGIYVLLNKTECDGYYSIGNSMDIVTSLNIMYEFDDTDTNNELDNNNIKQLYNIFVQSIDLHKIVIIY